VRKVKIVILLKIPDGHIVSHHSQWNRENTLGGVELIDIDLPCDSV